MRPVAQQLARRQRLRLRLRLRWMDRPCLVRWRAQGPLGVHALWASPTGAASWSRTIPWAPSCCESCAATRA